MTSLDRVGEEAVGAEALAVGEVDFKSGSLIPSTPAPAGLDMRSGCRASQLVRPSACWSPALGDPRSQEVTC